MSTEFEAKLDNIAIKLFDIGAVAFGSFLTKSGIQTPVYFDLRVLVSYPDVMQSISSLLYEVGVKDSSYDHLCGVPYTALPIATLLSVQANKPMLMRRKEAKSYGTKKMIEGHFKAGQTCLIIEDVVTSGSSILETVNDLKDVGLKTTEAVIILDREQGGVKNLKNHNITIKSLFTITKIIKILLKNKKITNKIADDVWEYLGATKAPTLPVTLDRTTKSYEARSKESTNPAAAKLFKIMSAKKTNLCVSVDLTETAPILTLLENIGEHVCVVKTHIDIIQDFNDNFIKQLKSLSEKFNFLIMEDRKFADIGNTVAMQFSNGLYKISEWADLVTVHSLPGAGILKGLAAANSNVGVVLLAEMSSADNFFSSEYTQKTAQMGSEYHSLVTGYVCQSRNAFKDSGMIQFTPGVQLESATDGLGQIYNTPEEIILERGADVAIVGRGIIAAKNPKEQAILYRETLWRLYEERLQKN